MLSFSMRPEVLHAGAMAGLSNSRWCFFLRSRQTGDPPGHLNSTQRKFVVNFKVALDLNLHVQEVCNFIKAALHFKLERLSQRKNLNLFRRERWLEIALIHFHWLYNFDPPILVVFFILGPTDSTERRYYAARYEDFLGLPSPSRRAYEVPIDLCYLAMLDNHVMTGFVWICCFISCCV